VVEDGALITGQNPASAAPIADALIARLQCRSLDEYPGGG